MAIIPESQVALMRMRKQLQQLIEMGDWESIASLEKELFLQISQASEDPKRSPRDLLLELRGVIKLYKELADICHRFAINVAR